MTSKKEEIMIQAFHGQIDIFLDELIVNPLDRSDLKQAEKLVKIHLNRVYPIFLEKRTQQSKSHLKRIYPNLP